MFNYYYYTNSYYMLGNILVLVGVALMALAQMKVSSAYNKYSKVQNSRHLTKHYIYLVIFIMGQVLLHLR